MATPRLDLVWALKRSGILRAIGTVEEHLDPFPEERWVSLLIPKLWYTGGQEAAGVTELSYSAATRAANLATPPGRFNVFQLQGV